MKAASRGRCMDGHREAGEDGLEKGRMCSVCGNYAAGRHFSLLSSEIEPLKLAYRGPQYSVLRPSLRKLCCGSVRKLRCISTFRNLAGTLSLKWGKREVFIAA